MTATLSFVALVLSVLYYAVRASEVRMESLAVRKRKRWISGSGAVVISPVVVLLSREAGIDQKMLGLLAGILVVCVVMFASSFIGAPRKEKESA